MSPESDQRPDLNRLRIDRSGSRSAPRRAGWAPPLVLVVLFLGYVAWREGWIAGADPRPEVTLARVARSGGAPASSGVAANGYVVARRSAALSTDIQGRLVELTVEEGDRVEEGDLIARLDTRQLEASLARAEADLLSARASAEFAAREYERYANLVETGDATEAARDEAEATRDETAARVAALEAEVAELEVMIDKSSVYAPFDGVITAKNAEIGEVVSAISAAGPNARGAVATIVDFDTLEVQVELAQTSLAAAEEGAPVTIYLDAFPQDGYRGEVRQIWPTANRQQATVELRATFLERDDRILPEMGVRVVFHEDEPDEAGAPRVTVPAAALLGGDDPFVLLYDDGVVRRRPVRVGGEAPGGRVAIAEGLTGGERVVLDPPDGLEDGDEVRTREES